MGEGGQAKVFKARFHRKEVAMKYVPLDHVRSNYAYRCDSYGCHEFDLQEKFFIDRNRHLRLSTVGLLNGFQP